MSLKQQAVCERESFFVLYKKLEKDILKRLADFDKVLIRDNEKEIFEELAFCLFTPQSKAVSCFEAVAFLKANNLLFNGNHIELVKHMRKVRFLNNKAGYLIEARNLLSFNGNSKTVLDILKGFRNNIQRREWLFKNIKGLGFKESSHFLRNIGFYKDIAILDRHILKNLVCLGVINEIPVSLSPKKYVEIELKLISFCNNQSIFPEVMDFVLWYKEAGEIFK